MVRRLPERFGVCSCSVQPLLTKHDVQLRRRPRTSDGAASSPRHERRLQADAALGPCRGGSMLQHACPETWSRDCAAWPRLRN